MPNDELFVKVLAQIEREPQRHDQSTWIEDTECGTIACFAGWAAVIGGARRLGTSQTFVLDGRQMHVADAAAQLLDLVRGGSAAWRLFYEAQGLDHVYYVSADLLGIDEQVLRDKVAAEVSA